jgi:ribosomal protein S18 acetylase RimI-like enzyme
MKNQTLTRSDSKNKSTTQQALVIKEYAGGFKETTKYFTATIYKNFRELTNDPTLKHTPNEINKLLKSPKMYSLLVYDSVHKMLAYLIGEIMELQNGRMVFYITYIYVASKYRGLGIASKLINIIFSKVDSWDLDGIMLICDTENKLVHDFYLKRGFMPDQTYRRYDQHEVISWYKNK